MKQTLGYVTAAEMKAIDRTAIDKYGVPAALLMENAGAAVAEEIAKSFEPAGALVISGYGNNGGDGFVVARHLLKKGSGVTVFLVGRPRPFSPETEDNFKSLLGLGCAPSAIYDTVSMERAFSAARRPDIIIDALFGIGIRGRLDELYIKLIDRVNGLGAPIVAVDLPSGLDADAGTPCPVAVKASKTVTLAIKKAGFGNPESTVYTGEVVVADIGIPQAAIEDVLKDRYAD